MRISTAGMYAQGLQAMLQRQGELARTSEQMSSGVRSSAPVPDPAASTADRLIVHFPATQNNREREGGASS